jgi:hypothetical protein
VQVEAVGFGGIELVSQGDHKGLPLFHKTDVSDVAFSHDRGGVLYGVAVGMSADG